MIGICAYGLWSCSFVSLARLKLAGCAFEIELLVYCALILAFMASAKLCFKLFPLYWDSLSLLRRVKHLLHKEAFFVNHLLDVLRLLLELHHQLLLCVELLLPNFVHFLDALVLQVSFQVELPLCNLPWWGNSIPVYIATTFLVTPDLSASVA